MKILLHSCCAPCANKCIDTIRKDENEPTLFWYNPNIHPFTEYKARRNALREYAELSNTSLAEEGEYGLRFFLDEVMDNIDSRCQKCYQVRMDKTAEYAKKNNFDGFTTSLLISPYQDHEQIKQTAMNAAAKHDIKFTYYDFRPSFREGQKAARELGLYMQKYCGCIFSEEERYAKK